MSFFVFALPLIASISLESWYCDAARARRIWPALAVSALIVCVTGVHLVLSQSSLTELNGVMERTGSLVAQLIGPALPLRAQDGTLNEFVQRQVIWTVAISVLSIACLLAVRVKRLPPSSGIATLTGVLVIDLWAAWSGMQPTSNRKNVFPNVPVFQSMQEKGHPNRINFDAIAIDGLPIPYGLEELQGYDAMVPERFWRTLRSGLSPHWQTALESASATPIYVYPAPPKGDPAVPEEFVIDDVRDGVIVATNKNALPRARLVGATEVYNSLETMLDRINAPGFDPSNLALVEGPHAPQFNTPSIAPPGDAQIKRWTWNSVIVEIDADERAVLVLAEAYYPGLEAHIDGSQPADIFTLYHVFRGVCVP
ncbi:MAG: hypothetical protein AAB570_03610, partial [Patescibacteria group bacterium]